MSNNLQRQISLDGWRNVAVRWTGVLDSGDVTVTPALALSELIYNDPRNRLTGLRVDKIQWSVNDDMNAILEWNAATPQLIAVLTQSGELCYKKQGGMFPNRGASGYDGSINLRTVGYPAGRTVGFSLFVQFVKLYD